MSQSFISFLSIPPNNLKDISIVDYASMLFSSIVFVFFSIFLGSNFIFLILCLLFASCRI